MGFRGSVSQPNERVAGALIRRIAGGSGGAEVLVYMTVTEASSQFRPQSDPLFSVSRVSKTVPVPQETTETMVK